MKKVLFASICIVMSTPTLAAPNGNYNLEIKTKFPWPMAAIVSGDKITLKSRGRTTIVGSTLTKAASATKITGKADFTTKICKAGSQVTISLRFNKDGSFKSGSANGRCKRTSGTANFRGQVILK